MKRLLVAGFDLDRPETLPRKGAHCVLHGAPPPAEGDLDTRTANLFAALEESRILPARLVYVSTSGIYDNRRLKEALGVHLSYPTIHEGLRHAQASGVH